MQYDIIGGNLPAVICKLDGGEGISCQSGAMSWMTRNIKMMTKGGGIGKMFGRALSGESMFLNHYVAESAGEIAFASKFPGEIRPYELDGSSSLIAQKGSFLAAEEGVDMSVFLQKKIAGGLFGGEGFIMEKFSGRGTVFLEIDGSAIEYRLGNGEEMIIDTGYLVLMDETCSMDIEMVKGVTNVLFGGEGLFNTIVKGPGRVVIQTMPISKTMELLSSMIPKAK